MVWNNYSAERKAIFLRTAHEIFETNKLELMAENLDYCLYSVFTVGAMTALWSNPFFMRMTEVSGWDYKILSF